MRKSSQLSIHNLAHIFTFSVPVIGVWTERLFQLLLRLLVDITQLLATAASCYGQCSMATSIQTQETYDRRRAAKTVSNCVCW